MRILYTLFAIIPLLLACDGDIGLRTDVTIPELQRHISYLASDELAGRQTGTEGDSLAAEYIRKQFKRYGLEPVEGDGFQSFTVTSRLEASDKNSFEWGGSSLNHGSDFTPLSISQNGSVTADVVFAGYGFIISSDTLEWNDYESIDAKGKWVMVLRADPEVENNASGFAAVSSDRHKAMTARDVGAAGIILVSGVKYDPNDEFEALRNADLPAGIPAVRLTRNSASHILAGSGSTVEEIETKLNETRKPASFATGVTVTATTDLTRINSPTRNVAMVLPGSDETLKNEYVIIGAHYDHLGMGGPGSSSRATDTVAVHYGADDNASGVALMIEMAGRFAGTQGSNARSLVFVAFSGEEMGLLGARFFADNPPFDLKSANAMVNLDMVGRLRETGTLQVGGAGTAAGLPDILTQGVDTSVLRLAISDEGYGPSDHSAFYGKEIPVVFVSTGAHLDYHTPSDTKERINYEGMISISDYLYGIIQTVANSEERLVFQEAGPKDGGSRGMRRKGVTLGIMPDFAGNVKDGLRADFVTPGRPAALGGMKRGDIIRSVNGKPVSNIEDYMFRLNQLKQGETITVEIDRDGKKEVLLIQL